MSNAGSPPPPFSCRFTPNIPELLQQLNCSLMLSTYQAGKLIFLSSDDNQKLIQLPRTFKKVMGVGLKGKKLVLAQKEEVLVLVNSPELAATYPPKPNTYDALFMPRATYHTGMLDIHDIDLGNDDTIYGVNTSFSCLIKVDDNYSFTPIWKPPFITEIVSEDRCHLNGMAIVDGKPKYVTAFSQGNKLQSWRDTVTSSGIVMDVDTNEVIANGLPMPHSPRWVEGRLLVLFSAAGELAEIDPATGESRVVKKLDGFVRGMSYYQDYLFIGLSRLRKNSSTFAHLPIAEMADKSGIVILHLPTAAIVGEVIYDNSVDELYDVQVLPNYRRPNILNTIKDIYTLGLSTPQTTYWGRKQEQDVQTI